MYPGAYQQRRFGDTMSQREMHTDSKKSDEQRTSGFSGIHRENRFFAQ